MPDLISVIIPVYKVEDFLNRCVDSILDQTYENLEIILVDDGSPDRCGVICDEYAKKDDRIKVIHKENGGLSDARNVGIEAATGDYITFLDSDDWVHMNYLKVLHSLLKSKNADISVCNFVKIYSENIPPNTGNAIIYEYSNIDALNQLSGEFYVQMVVAWGKLYKTDLFNDIRFPVGKIHEDEFTTYKLLYKAYKVVFTTEPLLYYWQRQDSIMGSGFKIKNRLHAIEAYGERVKFYEKIGQPDLVEKTYKALFGYNKSIKDNIHMFDDEDSKIKFINDFKNFKSKLRSNKHSLKFKLYYEAYYISPMFARLLEKLNERLRG